MNRKNAVLISWIAFNNDPFERVRETRAYRLVDGKAVAGPTLTLLHDEKSPLRGAVTDVVLLYRQSATGGDAERRTAEETAHEIRKRDQSIRVQFCCWHSDDPTDHKSIFKFLEKTMPDLRREFLGRELIIHISPGTPSMHTVWVLMAETGFIPQPFRLVKSYRPGERKDGRIICDVEIGIETFYKKYVSEAPLDVEFSESRILWDRRLFRSRPLIDLYNKAARFAKLNVPILILGERGTGKTTLASWIRIHSSFHAGKGGEWPAVACGQYTPETMRSELFGHAKGAFTDAKFGKEGLLSKANNDTLFLDEVGDVSSEVQRLLIKAIEEKRYYPLGENKPVESNFRLLTATNLSWDLLVTRLDPDFLDRISTFVLCFPPLRQLKEDIPWIWEQVYDNASRRAGIPHRMAALGKQYHERIVKHLQEHPLPGNLRTLYQVAYHFLAARCDVENGLSMDECVVEALAAINGSALPLGSAGTPAIGVARSFANQEPLDKCIEMSKRLDCGEVEGELRRYLATEIRRIAKSRGVPVESICTVSERTIRNWLQ
ncbi:sigma 54-interacting transcriptional regulator [Geomonas sp. Red69]|uniref:sigma-54-dependent transcriptional regulator n=1 Tax=Geomonas diazotrophica TaxID=2843197 RepID=UPI001C10D477|nr:sigma 54-interacting transcriptional regulator [Geomonas diazotrophica]MBU5638842.1 sigma 54-interacting transcriptional regulator [Geomonas diazotrophica]